MTNAYFIVGILMVVFGTVGTFFSMAEYKVLKNRFAQNYRDPYTRRPASEKDVEQARKEVRTTLFIILLAPVWPVIIPAVIIYYFVKGATQTIRVAVGKD